MRQAMASLLHSAALALIFPLLPVLAQAADPDRHAAQPADDLIEHVRPADIVRLRLLDLGFPDSVDRVTVSGAVSAFLVKDGWLRFVTPGDTGVRQQAAFTLYKHGVRRVLRVQVETGRPTGVVEHDEGLDNAQRRTPLDITGLGPDNSLDGGVLRFRLAGLPWRADARNSGGTIHDARGKGVDDLSAYWRFDPADNSFTIDGARLRQLMHALPPGSVNMSLNFLSEDAQSGANYDVLAIAHGAVLGGKLLTPQGTPAATFAGRRMLLSGYDKNLRKVAVVDAHGEFTFRNVIPDVYHLALADLDATDSVSTQFAVYRNTRNAEVTLVVGASTLPGNAVGGGIRQDGDPPAPRRLPVAGQGLAQPRPGTPAGLSR